MAPLLPHDVEKIRGLYYQEGLNASEIGEKFGVSMRVIYCFMEKHKILRRKGREQNALRFKNKQPSFTLTTDISEEDEKLKIAGVMLYWAEGYQSDTAAMVDFANSKPAMILVFLKFLREICGIREEKLRGFLYAHSDQNIADLIKFWSDLTKIPKEHFTKPYIRTDFRKEQSGKMKYGLLHIRYCDKKLLLVIKGWIEKYSEYLYT